MKFVNHIFLVVCHYNLTHDADYVSYYLLYILTWIINRIPV